tara:strand:+ start:535 stop:1254 length:720 start_codon:yes stop_codon:yes gene_type:complete
MNGLQLILRSSAFYIGYISSAIIAGCVACILGPLLTLEARLKVFSLWPRFVNWFLYSTCRISVSVEGKENIPKGPHIIVSNHQGQWETFYFQYLFFPMITILKRELLYIPLWGWGMYFLRPIAINRKRPTTALKKIMKEGIERLNKGLCVLFFPEGTRNKPREIGKYASSAFLLSLRSGVPLLPVVHNSGDCWPAHRFVKRPGTIFLRIGKPIKVGMKAREAAKVVEAWSRKNLQQINV